MATLESLQFEVEAKRYASTLQKIQRNIDCVISNSKKGIDLSETSEVTDEMSILLQEYEKVLHDYKSHLRNQQHSDSRELERLCGIEAETVRGKVAAFIQNLKSSLPEIKRSSQKTVKSNRSGASSRLTSELMRHTVKLEEAKTRLKYAAEEAELIKQEAEIKASRTLLTVKRELAEAESGLSAVRKVLSFSDVFGNHTGSEHGSYVLSQNQTNFRVDQYVSENVNVCEPPPEGPHESRDLNNISDPPITYSKKFVSNGGTTKQQHELTTNAKQFCVPKQSDATELAKLVAKNQLLPKRLWVFDDKPARYLTWKFSFLNVMSDLCATTLEHLDLLVNHLGHESKRQAENIRNSNPRFPEKAIDLIWERLDREYGSAESIEWALKQRINDFPTLTDGDHKRFFDLSDLAAEVESVKCDHEFRTAFAYYDSNSGINDFVRKLPRHLCEKWAVECDRYKTRNNVSQAPFSLLTKYLRDLARLRNDPSYVFDTPPRYSSVSLPQQPKLRNVQRNVYRSPVVSSKIEVVPDSDLSATSSSVRCPIHGENSKHALKDCVKFLAKTVKDRKNYLFQNGFCLRCSGSKRHFRKNCREKVKCIQCGSTEHDSILHPELGSGKTHEGESQQVNSSCTEVCNTQYSTSKSCAKILLVNVFRSDQPYNVRRVYCMIDDQSNKSLAASSFFDFFGERGPETEYVLSSCAGKFTTSGRKASGYIVQSLDESCSLELPSLIECNDIPNNREEIPSPSVAHSYSHLRDVASRVPELDNDVDIEVLIGRDLIAAHHVLDQRVGGDRLPYGQKLPLGWVIIGDVCLGGVHQPKVISVSKTSILANGRPTHLGLCDSEFWVKEDPIFQRTPDDEKPGLSVQDKKFLGIMENGFRRTSNGQWEAPLPFNTSRPVLPDSKALALRRAKSFDASLKCNPDKCSQVVEFMKNLLNHHHAELAPELPPSQEQWYLPLFAVYHPQKPSSVRVVFDSSAKVQGVSLNTVLLQGPDLYNSLLGILLRFRREKVAVTMDVEQMFYNFKVPEEHRRYLRFLWHRDNVLSQPLVIYQMTVHVFGNSPSPAIATYGLRKAVEGSSEDVKDFVNNDFYVDDGLLSCETENEAVDLAHRTKHTLLDNASLRLHKFASNSRKVLNSFETNDLAKNFKDLDLGIATLPVQRSLGLLWNTETDEFIFKVHLVEKPYTRRGLLSTINSIYDPIGFAQPVVIRGKQILREMMSVTTKTDWDDPLPEVLRDKWSSWVNSLTYLEHLSIPRMYSSISFASATKREVHVFSDASKDAIAAAAYLKLYDVESSCISFLLGKAKVAPVHGHTIPRLELCAAVLATEVAETVRDQVKIPQDDFFFYSDSQVVLGYIANESRRFYIYVGNRVSRIRLFSKPSQWHYVSSENNPADVATRLLDASELKDSKWILGPDILPVVSSLSGYGLVDPDHDVEVRTEVIATKTDLLDLMTPGSVFSDRFSRFSDWNKLVLCIARLKFLVIRYSPNRTISDSRYDDPEFLRKSECAIIAAVQRDVFAKEIQCIKNEENIPHASSIKSICPVLGADGVLRVGGRLNNVAENVISVKNPVILPKNHHVTRLVVRRCHQEVFHQGRHFTEGAVRAAGYWIVGAKRMISSEIKNCVRCRKLRGHMEWQQMSDLPEDRCQPAPPFSYVGIDTFGPWSVMFRRTRGGSANQKRWALLFTCLVTRAIHIEVIEELTSSAFINALRRMVAIRGPVVQFRSDRGTNFVGGTDDLSIDAEFVEHGPVAKYLSNSRTVWKFNPPHAPHMGGAWERLIGISKRILNSMLLERTHRNLTHEVLTTLMAEVCAIVNNRPLVDVSSDPDSPSLLSPSMLLTMKTVRDVNPFSTFSSKEVMKSTWKYVQALADEFWQKWRSDYLSGLQVRRKWQNQKRNIKAGDVVLMRDSDCSRNEWPTGIIQETFPSQDGFVRKVSVAVLKDNKRVVYVRPVTELVTLLEVD